jgi:hypothetical protein
MKLSEAPTVLTHDEIVREVARMSYRPGWVLSVFLDPFEGSCFRVVASVPNAYRPDEPTELRVNSRMPPLADLDALRVWVWHRLDLIERHECREWFKIDGRLVFDPHSPVEPAPGEG